MHDEDEFCDAVDGSAASNWGLFQSLVSDKKVLRFDDGVWRPVEDAEDAWRFHGVDAWAVPEQFTGEQPSGRSHHWATFDHYGSPTAWQPVDTWPIPQVVTIYARYRYRYSHAEGGCYTWGAEPLWVFLIEREENESRWAATARVEAEAQAYIEQWYAHDMDTSADHYVTASVELAPLVQTTVGQSYYC